jgi:hypothetical protein
VSSPILCDEVRWLPVGATGALNELDAKLAERESASVEAFGDVDDEVLGLFAAVRRSI